MNFDLAVGVEVLVGQGIKVILGGALVDEERGELVAIGFFTPSLASAGQRSTSLQLNPDASAEA